MINSILFNSLEKNHVHNYTSILRIKVPGKIFKFQKIASRKSRSKNPSFSPLSNLKFPASKAPMIYTRAKSRRARRRTRGLDSKDKDIINRRRRRRRRRRPVEPFFCFFVSRKSDPFFSPARRRPKRGVSRLPGGAKVLRGDELIECR